MRKKIVAGNWKMNLNPADGNTLVQEILAGLPTLSAHHQVVIAPPFVHLGGVAPLLATSEKVALGAQNCHDQEAGAYTGEVSAAMLQAVGVKYVIIGHSERRAYNHEDNALLARKVNQALANGLEVIFCCGEALEVRDAGTQNEWVGGQISDSLFHLTPEQMAHIVVAYEPIWAIGTGRTASSAQAQDMHAFIRGVLAQKYGNTVADATPILYGGSCKPSNAAELFACPDVDGGLIGGAALKSTEFLGIIAAMGAE